MKDEKIYLTPEQFRAIPDITNDQWKLDGDCAICRRRNYCTKACKANRISTYNAARAFLLEKMFKAGVKNGMAVQKDGEQAD